MGQAAARETISELIDVTLKGVVPLKKELRRGVVSRSQTAFFRFSLWLRKKGLGTLL